jgi:NarL family two-component system response regulator LiaR
MNGESEQTTPIRVLIADDHSVLREGLKMMLDTQPDMEVVGEARDGREAIAQAGALQPQVMLLDLIMPELGGLEALGEIRRVSPQTRVVVLTSSEEQEKMIAAMRAGAQGYILKTEPAGTVVNAIRTAARGEAALAPSVQMLLMRAMAHPTVHPEDALSPREREVLALLGQGLSNKQIAARLSMAEKTARAHVSSILQKLNLEGRTQAALFAREKGLI